jgi:glyoxylase-like metal-dependent hydrolase (beta-lactamase superfamily II)
LQSQLAEIGYKPSDVTYLALSHYHYDHSANANAFAGAMWLVQKPERELMFSGPLGPSSPNSPTAETTAARFAALQNSKTILLDGDHDVFGDGSVVIISTPGHTPGHQSLLVNLPKTGAILLSGDLYHYPAEREQKDFTPFAALGDPAKEVVSKAKVEALLKEKRATLWMQHDLIANEQLKEIPRVLPVVRNTNATQVIVVGTRPCAISHLAWFLRRALASRFFQGRPSARWPDARAEAMDRRPAGRNRAPLRASPRNRCRSRQTTSRMRSAASESFSDGT